VLACLRELWQFLNAVVQLTDIEILNSYQGVSAVQAHRWVQGVRE
jgi:hypothetical protein